MVVEKLANLNPSLFGEFEPFTVAGYEFRPTREDTEASPITGGAQMWRYKREHSPGGEVVVPSGELPSVRIPAQGAVGRRFTLLDDILLLMSIMLGRNVRRWQDRMLSWFPLIPEKPGILVHARFDEIKSMLDQAIESLVSPGWRSKYADGFHLTMFCNAADITVWEARFLSFATIWEFLYSQEMVPQNGSPVGHYEAIIRTPLQSKLCALIRRHIAKKGKVCKKSLHVFTHLRNQLTH